MVPVLATAVAGPAVFAGAAGAALLSTLLGILAGLGVTAAAGTAACRLILQVAPPAGYISLPVGPAVADVLRQAAYYQAAYLVNAAVRIQRRLAAGQSLTQAVAHERAFFRAHRAAQRKRLAAARRVDLLSGNGHRWLRWKLGATKTHTPVCRAANGHPFRADRRPLPGWPGATHPRCDCSATPGHPPRPGELTVDEVTAPLIAAGLD